MNARAVMGHMMLRILWTSGRILRNGTEIVGKLIIRYMDLMLPKISEVFCITCILSSTSATPSAYTI